MSNIEQSVERDYNGYTEEDLAEFGLECYGMRIPFDLYDDDQYWLTNGMKETNK